jgi:two-component sensor histidine kinase
MGAADRGWCAFSRGGSRNHRACNLREGYSAAIGGTRRTSFARKHGAKHRLKNLFAVTSSICYQTIKSDIPRELLGQAVIGRIQAVGSAQDLLSATGAEGSDLRTLVEAVVKPLSPDASRLEIIGPEVLLPAEARMPFALILHELATNAVKYGAWASTPGRTVVQWSIQNGRELEFRWHEQGAAVRGNGKRNGFGSVVIKEALSQGKVQHQIGAHKPHSRPAKDLASRLMRSQKLHVRYWHEMDLSGPSDDVRSSRETRSDWHHCPTPDSRDRMRGNERIDVGSDEAILRCREIRPKHKVAHFRALRLKQGQEQ